MYWLVGLNWTRTWQFEEAGTAATPPDTTQGCAAAVAVTKLKSGAGVVFAPTPTAVSMLTLAELEELVLYKVTLWVAAVAPKAVLAKV